MRRRVLAMLVGLSGSCLVATAGAEAQEPPPPVGELRVDPLMLASVKEFRNIIETIGADIYPDWDAQSVPMLLYRPGVQELLVGAPRRPPGFSEFTGATVLGSETVYARNDSTVMDIDDQNTSITLDSIRVLVVADRYSRERNQLRAMLEQPAARTTRWLDEWGFVQSPYDEVMLLLHEAFHVHQDRLAPIKQADEGAVARYPLLDPTNNALVALEGRILRDALLATEDTARLRKTAEFVAVRTTRQAGLDAASVAYENLNEFAEGTARYVELRFLQLGERVTPVPEMYLSSGFRGYRDELRRRYEHRANDIVAIASNSDDRFGNRFGAGPMRFRLYDMGAAQGLLLDHVAPEWKSRIFDPGVYLADLLAEAVSLSDEERLAHLASAKTQYGYDSLFVNRQTFAEEGKEFIRGRVDAILDTPQTLVTIHYGAAGDTLRMGYTPFGVTAVNDQAAIYDLVPIALRFQNGVVLRMKSVAPVLVDRAARTVTFAVASSPTLFPDRAVTGLELDELSLTGSPLTRISVSGSRVSIELR